MLTLSGLMTGQNGLKRSTTQVLANEELNTKETLAMLEAKNFKELGLAMGSIELILKAVNQLYLLNQRPLRTKRSRTTSPSWKGQIKRLTFYYRSHQPLSPTKLHQYSAIWTPVRYGLGAKILKNRSAAPPRKKNYIATMHQVYSYGAWKPMFY